MKLLHFPLCLFTILFQAIFASSSLNGDGASLSSNKTAPFKSRKSRPKAKPVVGKLVWKKKLTSSKKKPQNKRGKSKSLVVKENELKLLIELLFKELVQIVIGYFDDGAYPSIVSTYNWLLNDKPEIAVDSSRVYVITKSGNIKGLNHSLANVKEDERRLIEFGDPQWADYWKFGSSSDGQYVSFSHSNKTSTDLRERLKCSVKWFTQSSGLGYGRPKRVALDGEDLSCGLLSRNGQTLCSHNYADATRVYQTREEAGNDTAGFMKFELNGEPRAVSGSGNRVVVKRAEQLEIHDIDKGAGKLVCQIDVIGAIYACALNENGREVAFINENELQIVGVDEVVGNKADQPAIVTIKVPESTGWIYKMVYSDEGKLHVLHDGNKISIFAPLTKEFILIEAPQGGQVVVDLAISPNAEYVAILKYVGKKEENGKDICIYRTIVKRKLNDSDSKDLFGCKVDKNQQAAKP